jgi:DNA-binding MarR family transcriptional regulator
MASQPNLPCLCANLRRAARALTQTYDEALRPLGLRVTQFTILQALSLTGEVSQGELGQLLAMDSTSLTRSLRLLEQQGWIQDRPGKDRRERRLSVSAGGRRQLQRATPHWEALQRKLRLRLGEARWRGLFTITTEVTQTLNRLN